jgi:pimeloyl-ACP methyl ester carboxylesterase
LLSIGEKARVIAIDAAGDGEPLGLLHGVGANRSIWQHAARRLARTRLVLAPDLPGFGESPPVADGFDLNQTADAVADAIVARAAQPFDLVGNSLGGAVAAVLACRRPELVRRLVLVAPAGFNPRPRLLSEVAGRLGGSATSLRRVLGMPFVANANARRVLLWGSVAAPERMAPNDARTMLQGSRGSSRIGAAIASVLTSDLRSRR